MPNGKEKQKKRNTDPSPSLIRRMFGGPMSESTATKWPELQSEWAGRELEMPAETTLTNRVRPMNWYEKYASGPNADAITWPWGTIALNKDVIEQNKSNLGDVLVHELTHIGQKPGILKYMRNLLPGGPEYLARPEEQEAFQAEAERRVRRKDIQLPSMK